MIERIDRVAIGATDLEAAVTAYQTLGFQVGPPIAGAARIPLEGADLVLLDLHAPTVAGQWEATTLANFLRERPGGLLGYAVAADFAIARARLPDATLLEAAALALNPLGWRGPLPIVVPGGPAMPAGADHPNGVRCLRELAAVVGDLEQAVARYGAALGLRPQQRDEVIPWRALRATFVLGSVELHLCAPNAPGLVAGMLALYGEGLWQVVLGVRDLEATRRRLGERGVALLSAPGLLGDALVDPERTMGARLVLREERA
jgi:catechol 2,3-dioxygenase-like lactoylglutathione lyase family enzyme